MTAVVDAAPKGDWLGTMMKVGIGAAGIVVGGLVLSAAWCSYKETGTVSFTGMTVCGAKGMFDVGKDLIEEGAKGAWKKIIKPVGKKTYEKVLKPIGKGAWNKAIKPGYKLLKDTPKKLEKGLGKATQLANPLSSKGFISEGWKRSIGKTKGWKKVKKGFKKLF